MKNQRNALFYKTYVNANTPRKCILLFDVEVFDFVVFVVEFEGGVEVALETTELDDGLTLVTFVVLFEFLDVNFVEADDPDAGDVPVEFVGDFVVAVVFVNGLPVVDAEVAAVSLFVVRVVMDALEGIFVADVVEFPDGKGVILMDLVVARVVPPLPPPPPIPPEAVECEVVAFEVVFETLVASFVLVFPVAFVVVSCKFCAVVV